MRKIIILIAMIMATAASADVRVLLQHQSVGRGMIGSEIRCSESIRATVEMRTLLNSDIAFWDHDYYNYSTDIVEPGTYVAGAMLEPDGTIWSVVSGFGAHRGSTNPLYGVGDVGTEHIFGEAFKTTPDNADALAFRDSCVSRFDAVLFKPGYRDVHMSSLATYQAIMNTASDWWYANYPDIIFAVLTPTTMRYPTDYSGTAGWPDTAQGELDAVAEVAAFKTYVDWMNDTWATRNPNNRVLDMWTFCGEQSGADDVKYFTKDIYTGTGAGDTSGDHHLNIAGSDATQALLVSFINNLGEGAVIINSADGEISQGTSVTISGDGFGVKAHAAPNTYDTIESGSFLAEWSGTGGLVPHEAESRHANSDWCGRQNFIGNNGDPEVSSKHGYFTGPSNLSEKQYAQYWFKLDAATWTWGTSGIAPVWEIGQSYTVAYSSGSDNKAGVWPVYYPVKLDHIGAADKEPGVSAGWETYWHDPIEWNANLANIKIFRMYNPGSASENFVMATQGYASSNSVQWTTESVSSPVHSSFPFIGNIELDVWHLIQVEYLESTAYTYDGEFTIWVDGVLTDTHSAIKTREVEDELKRPLILGFYNSWGDPGTDDQWFYIDDAVIDDSWARVEIGNNISYNDCTHREYVPATSWSNTSIVVDMNTGSFADQAAAWIFVTNEDGVVNTLGSPVTINAEGGDPGPMVGPSNLNAEGGN